MVEIPVMKDQLRGASSKLLVLAARYTSDVSVNESEFTDSESPVVSAKDRWQVRHSKREVIMLRNTTFFFV